MTILGDAGVGKTRLVARAVGVARGAQSRSRCCRTGRCLSYGQGITYWPLGEVLKEHFGILESDPPEIVARAARRPPVPRPHARARRRRRTCTRWPRASGCTTRGSSSSRSSSRERPTVAADRGPALGRGRALRPARDPGRAGARAAAAARDGAARAARPPARLGPSRRERRSTRARGAAAGTDAGSCSTSCSASSCPAVRAASSSSSAPRATRSSSRS